MAESAVNHYLGFLIMLVGFSILLFAGEINFNVFHFNITELIFSCGLFIFVALAEELFIRGYILGNLMKSFNKYIALTVSSVLFSLMPIFNPNINLFALIELRFAGIVFGLWYIYTKNLWFPVSFHFSWNFFQGSVFGFSVSGQNIYSLIEQKDLWAVYGMEAVLDLKDLWLA